MQRTGTANKPLPTQCCARPRTTPNGARTFAPGSTCCRSCPKSGGDNYHAGPASTQRIERRSTAIRHPIATTRSCSIRRFWVIWPASLDGSRTRADESLVTRIRDYMLKATREAKSHTSWITMNEDYEDALVRFIEQTLIGRSSPRFMEAFLPFQDRIARSGMVNSLAQLVLKVASPGVPDFYQGTELWDLNLVDPDNRHPVDYALRKGVLEDVERLVEDPDGPFPDDKEDAVREMLSHWEDGRIKMFITAQALRLRARLSPVFLDGTYEALEVEGERKEHVVATARCAPEGTIVAIVPRLTTALVTEGRPLPVGEETWGSTRVMLPVAFARTPFRNVLTGESLAPAEPEKENVLLLSELFGICPVALLVAAGNPDRSIKASPTTGSQCREN